MQHKKQNEAGFSAVEGLLMAIVVLLIVFIGYYVYHTQKQTNNTLTSAAKTSQNTPMVSSKAKTSKTSTTNSSQGYFVIKEWGVRAKYSGNLTLEYTYNSKNNEADFNSAQLKASNPSQCTDGLEGGGAVFRYAPADHVYGADEGNDLGSASKFFADPSMTNFKHLGNYYYWYVGPQSSCSDNFALSSQTNNAVIDLVQNLEAVPVQ